MPPNLLMKAHQKLNAAVDAAYLLFGGKKLEERRRAVSFPEPIAVACKRSQY